MIFLLPLTIFLTFTHGLPSLNFRKENVKGSDKAQERISGLESYNLEVQDGQNTLTTSHKPNSLEEVLDALEVMQDTYFDIFTGTWPNAIDWTSAVVGTQVSATLSSIANSLEPMSPDSCAAQLSWQNIIDRYFAQTSTFYFGENAFGLRNQAYDDMLWVVLGWLENIKFVEMYSLRHWNLQQSPLDRPGNGWHGLQFSPMAAHRARIFYDLASNGWDDSLCGGGMNWNPYLTPYKNAITNELYAAASIAMYLYFPGDNNTSPYFMSSTAGHKFKGLQKPHDPKHLENAIKAYKWLEESQMKNDISGLYQDGYHVLGWHRFPNGSIIPGTGKCDDLNTMVYTYNQGVILSASRGLWMATGARSYLDDGHALIDNVIRATGWPNNDRSWHGLGRGGILEEFCDHSGRCSQDGQTFKGIFFLHLSEFCRPLWPHEEDFISTRTAGFDRDVYLYHLARCGAYGRWIHHNADAALATKDEHGHFGMWWNLHQRGREEMEYIHNNTVLPTHAVDHLNPRSEIDEEDQRGVFHKSTIWDINDRGRGRTVETQSGGLAVLRARWNWQLYFS